MTEPTNTSHSHQPLHGITVIAIEQAVAGPFATRHLADLGARVIKVERPDGGDFARYYDETVKGMSSWFVWLNRSKESVTLNLKEPGAQEVLDRLLEGADVFLQNLAPGATERLGLGSAVLSERYPRLVVCNISGYGASGPYADRKAYDLIVQSEVGMLSITGTPEDPCKVGVSVADISAGMYAYAGILAALLERKTTRLGRVVDVALIDTLGEWMGFAAYYTTYGGSQPPRTGASHATIAPYGPFQTGDGQVVIAVQSDREWIRFCSEVLDQPAAATDDRFRTNTLRVKNRRVLEELIEARFLAFSSKHVVTLLDAAQIANSKIASVDEYLHHPQLAHRDRWREVDSPVGPLRTLIPALCGDGVEPAMGAIPALGEHTDEVLRELSFDAATIARWRKEEVI